MEPFIKIITTHNIQRHIKDFKEDIFDKYIRGCHINKVSFKNTNLKAFKLSINEKKIEEEGYNNIDFFRRYLIDNFFTPTYSIKIQPNINILNNNILELNKITEFNEKEIYRFKEENKYKIRLSRNGFFSVITEKLLSEKNTKKEITLLLDKIINNKYRGLLPLVLANYFLNEIEEIYLTNDKEKNVKFYKKFYQDSILVNKINKNIFPRHNTYIITKLPQNIDEDQMNNVIKNSFMLTDIFDIKKNIRDFTINPDIKVKFNDNICFVIANRKLNNNEEIAVKCFIRTFEYLFSMATEFETIHKETTKMLESVSEINHKICNRDNIEIENEVNKDINNLILKTSQFYRMLPHLRDGLVGNVTFKNKEVITIVKKISDMFQLAETEKWIKRNIDEINTFITHFYSIQAQHEAKKTENRENKSNLILNMLFILLSILQVPSFVKDMWETFQTKLPISMGRIILLMIEGIITLSIITVAVLFLFNRNKSFFKKNNK